MADSDSDNAEAAQTEESGRLVLPRVFRRCDAETGAVTVELSPGSTQAIVAGQQEVNAALDTVRQKIEYDARCWRHLGDPSERMREVGDLRLLADAKKYEDALSEAAGDRAPLPDWSVSLQVESSPDPGHAEATRIRVLLANTTASFEKDVADPGLQERSLFDACLTVDIEGGALQPFDFLLAPNNYRNKPRMPAKGINCTAAWREDSPGRLETETLPIYRQPLYRTRDELEVRFDSLSTPEAITQLEALARAMEGYLKSWDNFLASTDSSKFTQPERLACQRDRDAFAREIADFRLGMEALKRDDHLLDAFQLMNQTFAELAQASSGRIRAWRLFQIGFIVSQLPALAIRELAADADDAYAHELRQVFPDVGILWFPTGGGKTEAYLGLIAAALLYDRLRGKLRGLTAWMRFPLRMLSLQQLERLARVIASLNMLRSSESRLRVGDPFAMGYYVGEGATPNSLTEEEFKRYEESNERREDARRLRKCPFCGSAVEIKPIRQSWRLAHVCSNPQCFSNTDSSLGLYKGSLPICIVDSEIYRFLPSVLVGTVDKLAIAGLNRNFAHLVRGARQRCEAHGYTSYDECIEHWSGCKAGKKDLTKLDPIKDPGPSLLIQDELHLLRAELGVFNGHYEGLLRYLGRKAFLPAKVLAATATIEAYDTQAFHIYLSRARRYPQPAWEQGESFYATSRPERIRRTYIGIPGHTGAIEDPAMRVLGLYLREVRRLIANPRTAAEVMSRPDLPDESILAVLRLYDLALAYVNRKATGGRIIDKLTLLDRLLAREDLGSVLGRLLTGDQTIEDVGATLDRIEKEIQDTTEPRLNVVVATNLISHGVDLERINMMTICGLPSHYAEYVQSSSRAARAHPGIVFACFNNREARETSQYEFFQPMHANLDRLIEAVAVNRFASFAPQKTVPGLLVGVLLSDLTPSLYGAKISKPLDHIPTLQIALGLKPATASNTACVDTVMLKQAINEILGVEAVHPPALPAEVESVRRLAQEVLDDQIGEIGRTLERYLGQVLDPIISFRDVDEGIDFGSIEAADLVTRFWAR